MMTTTTTARPSYSYRALLAASERVNWRVEDLIGPGKRLDFGRPFMPESLARVESLDMLSVAGQRTLNQIRGFEYLGVFGLVEEFILPFVLDRARSLVHEEADRVRAYLQFAAEEAKHIDLFRRFRTEFEEGFGTPCRFIGPPEEIARAVLAKDPLAVGLVILQIEWMTQRHWIEAVRDEQALDPQFKSLLKHHWQEEAQHAKLDTLMITALAQGRSEASIHAAVNDYLEIGAMLDAGLAQQTAFNLESFQRATGCLLTADEAEALTQVQHQAQRWTFLGSGMTHPNFLETLEELSPSACRRIEDVAPSFC
jgi:hypothetical protein